MTPMCKLFTWLLSRFSYTDKTEMMEIYSGDRKISSASTSSQTRTATIQMLRGLVDRMRTLGPLPDDARIMMKLFYYDEVTPDDYEPPGFTSAETDVICMEGNPRRFRFQTVSTAFHSLQVRMIAEDAALRAGEEAEWVVEGDELATQVREATPRGGGGMDADVVKTEREHVSDTYTTAAAAAAAAVAAEDAVDAEDGACDDGGVSAAPEDSDSDVEPNGVRCPCLVDEVDGMMILCTVCSYWQHAICFKILDEDEPPDHHICNLCYSPSTPATDPELCRLDPSKAEDLCLWRRSLAACLEVTYVSVGPLAERLGVTDAVARRLLDRLEAEGYATSRGRLSSARKYVQKRKIKREALAKYLSSDNNNEVPMEVQ